MGQKVFKVPIIPYKGICMFFCSAIFWPIGLKINGSSGDFYLSIDSLKNPGFAPYLL